MSSAVKKLQYHPQITRDLKSSASRIDGPAILRKASAADARGDPKRILRSLRFSRAFNQRFRAETATAAHRDDRSLPIAVLEKVASKTLLRRPELKAT